MVHYVMAGPLPKRLWGSARVCLHCGGTGLYEDDDGDTFECGYCLGNGIKTGLLSPLEWDALQQPQRIPVRFIREVHLGHLRRILPKSVTLEGLVERALQELFTLLQHYIEAEAATLGISECAFYDDAPALHIALPGQPYFTYTDFAFPVLLCIERCGYNVAISAAATVAFGGPNAAGGQTR